MSEQPSAVAAETPWHPVRLVVTDDLHRSRLTVFFRLLLAIPHFFWLGLFTIGAFFVAFANWWATLFTGRSPKGMHGFLAGYVRYSTHVTAYLFLGANPYPAFYLGDDLKPYPVDVEIDPPAHQNRAKTFFRLFLALPAFFLTGALTGGGSSSSSRSGFSGGVGAIAALLSWFSAMIRGRSPRGLRDLVAWGLGYTAQTYAYLFLLTDRYPYSGPEAHLQGLEPAVEAEGRAQVVVTDDLRRSRLTVLFRLPLSFPHIVWLVGWTLLALFVSLLNWLCALVIGRAPRPFARFLAAYVRYATHFAAFFYVIGNQFPGFTGKAGSYPIDVELDPFADQKRLITFFKLLLVLPAAMISGAASSVLWPAGIFGWFASLVRGRMPEGLRNCGVWALGYNAQLMSYAFTLSDRYPFSSPTGTWRAG